MLLLFKIFFAKTKTILQAHTLKNFACNYSFGYLPWHISRDFSLWTSANVLNFGNAQLYDMYQNRMHNIIQTTKI